MNEPLQVQPAVATSDGQFVNTPLRQRLKEAVLRRILGGHYVAGERLVELRIAEEFGTSQGPVREALRELEATGLVTNIPRRGTYVSEVMGEGLREIYTVRGALEEQATRIVTARGGCDLEALGALVLITVGSLDVLASELGRVPRVSISLDVSLPR